jgi:4-amino-4-deoxy-L-arabinose transferase-like glycosyltransferase
MLHEEVQKVQAPLHNHPHAHRDAPSRMGMWMSLLCAIHCAALPLILVLVPAMGSSFIASEPVEWVLLGVAVAVALWSITRGYVRDHRKSFPALLLGVGILVVGLGHTVLPESWEPVTSVTGSLGIAAAQFVNLRLIRRFHRCEVHP